MDRDLRSTPHGRLLQIAALLGYADDETGEPMPLITPEQARQLLDVAFDGPLPPEYFTREAELAAENILAGFDPRDLLVSKRTLVAAWQIALERRGRPNKFAKDPRRFSWMPRRARDPLRLAGHRLGS